jgi:SAM-dependent methyltransferase
MTQKDIFLGGEGDAWFERNADKIARAENFDSDPVVTEIAALAPSLPASGTRVLEVGCGPGGRLARLAQNRGFSCSGVEPSPKAVAFAVANHRIDVRVGTADALPYDAGSFDVVIFGFCLYLCDREDLFRIAAEADRVLKKPGWVVIQDFFSPTPSARAYRHKAGVSTFKMDYRSLFAWHPSYSVYCHRVLHHEHGGYTDDPDEWVAVSVLRKA